MSIQIVSDLHLEVPKAYDVFEIVPHAPVLALVGDIGNVEPHRDDLTAFLDKQLLQFKVVLFVAGNHEAYQSTWTKTLSILKEIENDVKTRRTFDTTLGEFVVLDRRSYRLDAATVVLGCSLFSYIPPEREMAVSMGLNDFYHTEGGWDIASHNTSHARDLIWLNEEVTSLETDGSVKNIVILTHWCPTLDSCARDPKHTSDTLTSAFATDLTQEACFLSPKVKAWGFGHTHYNCDFVVDRKDAVPLRLVTNQRGYYFAQASGYEEGKLLWSLK